MNQLLFMGLGFLEVLILVIIVIMPFILTVICLIDIIRSTFRDPLNKVVWAIIVLLAPMFGAVAYFIWGRQQKLKHSTEI